MGSVLLRRVCLQLEYKDLIKDVPTNIITSCQEQLLVAMQTEEDPSVRRKICDAVAELARTCLGSHGEQVYSETNHPSKGTWVGTYLTS